MPGFITRLTKQAHQVMGQHRYTECALFAQNCAILKLFRLKSALGYLILFSQSAHPRMDNPGINNRIGWRVWLFQFKDDLHVDCLGGYIDI